MPGDLIRAAAVRKDLNKVSRAPVLETDQAKCDAIEARIKALEAPETRRAS
jgi:hypothetical protein